MRRYYHVSYFGTDENKQHTLSEAIISTKPSSNINDIREYLKKLLEKNMGKKFVSTIIVSMNRLSRREFNNLSVD